MTEENHKVIFYQATDGDARQIFHFCNACWENFLEADTLTGCVPCRINELELANEGLRFAISSAKRALENKIPNSAAAILSQAVKDPAPETPNIGDNQEDERDGEDTKRDG